MIIGKIVFPQVTRVFPQAISVFPQAISVFMSGVFMRGVYMPRNRQKTD